MTVKANTKREKKSSEDHGLRRGGCGKRLRGGHSPICGGSSGWANGSAEGASAGEFLRGRSAAGNSGSASCEGAATSNGEDKGGSGDSRGVARGSGAAIGGGAGKTAGVNSGSERSAGSGARFRGRKAGGSSKISGTLARGTDSCADGAGTAGKLVAPPLRALIPSVASELSLEIVVASAGRFLGRKTGSSTFGSDGGEMAAGTSGGGWAGGGGAISAGGGGGGAGAGELMGPIAGATGVVGGATIGLLGGGSGVVGAGSYSSLSSDQGDCHDLLRGFHQLESRAAAESRSGVGAGICGRPVCTKHQFWKSKTRSASAAVLMFVNNRASAAANFRASQQPRLSAVAITE